MSDQLLPAVLLVGHGRMGSALFAGWREAGIAPSVVLTRSPPALAPPHLWAPRLDAVPDPFAPRLIVAAIKPQLAAEVLPSVGRRFPGVPILSIMAGQRISSIGSLTGTEAVIRAMPNTPVAIGHGISGMFASALVGEADRRHAARLLGAVGEVVWLDREEQIDAVTALSGSGPAYIFLLAELMEESGVGIGLPRAMSRRLARATVAGAGRLLETDPRDAASLREAVTSKGGTTEQALAVLMADLAWPALVRQAMGAAAERARLLADA